MVPILHVSHHRPSSQVHSKVTRCRPPHPIPTSLNLVRLTDKTPTHPLHNIGLTPTPLPRRLWDILLLQPTPPIPNSLQNSRQMTIWRHHSLPTLPKHPCPTPPILPTTQANNPPHLHRGSNIPQPWSATLNFRTAILLRHLCSCRVPRNSNSSRTLKWRSRHRRRNGR